VRRTFKSISKGKRAASLSSNDLNLFLLGYVIEHHTQSMSYTYTLTRDQQLVVTECRAGITDANLCLSHHH
jgi:hypothetical protein